jgi:hypothetical protein
MSTPVTPGIDWEHADQPLRDFEDEEIESALACGDCTQLRAELARKTEALAKAHALLKLIRRSEPKAGKPELGEDPAEAMIVGYASAAAGVRARIDLYFCAAGRGIQAGTV